MIPSLNHVDSQKDHNLPSERNVTWGTEKIKEKQEVNCVKVLKEKHNQNYLKALPFETKEDNYYTP